MKSLSLLLIAVLFYSCQSNNNVKANSSSDSSLSVASATTPTAKKDNYFVVLKGTIGNYLVTAYLCAQKQTYTGYYYYDSKEQPIYFSGDDTTNRGRTTLSVYHEDSTEIFVLDFDGRSANGSWTYHGKTLPVTLSKTDMAVTFSYRHWQDSVKLTDTLAASPQATANISSVWPEGSSATDEFTKTEIADLLLPKTKSRNIDSIFQQSGKAFFDDYKSENELTKEDLKDLNENASQYTYDLSDDVSVCYQTSKMMVLAYMNYSYTGGAHGNYGTSYVPLDLASNRVITLSQILTPEGTQRLRSLLEASYRRDNHLTASQPLTDGGLFENKIEPNKNFYITGKQLVFTYVPYEISSYAAGQIDIAISMNDLQSYLQPSFKSLLQ